MFKSKILRDFKSIAVLALGIAASFFGADGVFAMAEVATVDTAAPSASADSKGLKTQTDGQASATNVTESGFNQEDIEKAIAKFRPFRFPLEYDIANEATQVTAEQYEKIHYRSGVNMLEDTYNGAAKSFAKNAKVTIPATDFASGTIACFPEYATVVVKGVEADGGDLALFVVKNDDTNVVFETINVVGSAVSVPSGSVFLQCAYACSESQMIVSPDNYQPVPTTVYLQKKIANIVVTDEWLNISKKVPFVMADLQDNALYNFKRKTARNRWLGYQAKKTVRLAANKMGNENVYFEQGVLRQMPMFYSLKEGKVAFSDLNAIGKMQFTENSANSTARVYCGKNAIEKLLNMDVQVNKNYSFEDKDVYGMKFRIWKSNFGELEFVYDPTLDDIGYEDFMVVLDIKNAAHYVKRAEKTDVQDMKDGAGEIREAKRYVYSQIDCLALKGYNAILVGPAEKIAKARSLGGIQKFAASTASLGENEKVAGKVFYLTADAGGFGKGTLVEYNPALGTWIEYSGEITV